MKIAVIIVSWNVKKFVGRCIASIHKYIRQDNCEILLVDNASADDTVSFVRRRYPDVKIIANEKNRGFAAANNQAVMQTDAQILIFANPDTELRDDVQPLVEALNDEKTAAVFGRLVYPSGETQAFIRSFPNLINRFGEALGIPHLFPGLRPFQEMIRHDDRAYDRAHFIDAASGAFFLMKRDVFLKCGMFDTRFFVYAEDTDLFYRLKQKGYRIFYNPGVRIIHHHGKSTVQNPNMYAMQQKNTSLFIKKHHSAPYAFLYRYVLLVFYDSTRLLLSMIKAIRSDPEYRKQACMKLKRHLAALKWELFGQWT